MGAETSSFDGIEIIAKPEDRDKLVAALRWLGDLAPDNKRVVCEYIPRIVLCPPMKSRHSKVFAGCRGCAVSTTLIRDSSIEQLAQLFAKAGHMARECADRPQFGIQDFPR